jgi:hypothetical protein
LGSQLWGLDFHTSGFQDRNLKTFRTWFSGCGISILGPGFHTGSFTVAFGHGHPLVRVEPLKNQLGYLNNLPLGLRMFFNSSGFRSRFSKRLVPMSGSCAGFNKKMRAGVRVTKT